MSPKKIGVAVVFVLIGIGLLAISRSFIDQIACEGQPINFRLDPTAEQQIWGERIISQEFISPRNGLNRIDVVFQTYRRQNTHDVTLRLLEIPPDAENPLQGIEVATFTFNASDVRDRVWRTFNFQPVSDSAEKKYLIQIQSPDSAPGNALTVGGIEWDTYAPGTVYLGPAPALADIAFRACYHMTTVEKLQVLSDQITQNRPALWGNSVFFWGSLVIYAILMVGLFWKLSELVLAE